MMGIQQEGHSAQAQGVVDIFFFLGGVTISMIAF